MDISELITYVGFPKDPKSQFSSPNGNVFNYEVTAYLAWTCFAEVMMLRINQMNDRELTHLVSNPQHLALIESMLEGFITTPTNEVVAPMENWEKCLGSEPELSSALRYHLAVILKNRISELQATQ